MAWHGPRDNCGCCGCEIFSVDDILTSGATTEIDGYTVLDRELPDPPWQLCLNPLFTGQLSTAKKVEFRLLGPGDAVFAEWSMQKLVAVVTSANELTEDVYIEWDAITPIDDNRQSLSSFAPSWSYTNLAFWAHRLVLREFSGWLGPAKGSVSTSFLIVNDTLAGFKEFSSSAIQLPDTEANTKYILNNAGCPLPLGETTLTDNGPFRIGCKVTGSSFVVPVVLEKIYQEPISSGYYGASFYQEEENVDCDFPYACRVTFPSYATPDFELVSASSDVTLNSTEIAHATTGGCTSLISYRRISEIQSNQTEFGFLADGTLIYDGADSALPFVYGLGQSSLNDAGLVQSNLTCTRIANDGVVEDWECTDTLTFRSGYFPFAINLTTAAHGSDTTKLVVTASFDLWAWTSEDDEAPNTFGSFTQVDGGSSFAVGSYYSVVIDPYDTANSFIQWTRVRVLYSKTVDRWLHEPPEIAFTSADMTSDTATYRLVTDIGFRLNYSVASFTPSPALTIVELDNTSIAFTVKSRTSPRVPHP